MELNEAVLRILRHSRLIVAVVLVCVAVPFLASRSAEETYTAAARVSFGPEPSNEDEAVAMVDTADALVTTPGEVEAALERHRATRDPDRVEEQVAVDSVGVSGVLTISVSDTDPVVARVVANNLARRLLTARRHLVLDPLVQRLEEVDAQLATINADIRDITTRGSNLPEAIDARRLRLEAALSRQAGLRAERENLVTSLDATARPEIIAMAALPTEPDPAGRVADLIVAGLLGLVLGVASTAIVEALRPTIVSRDALSAALAAPILGRVPNPALEESDVRDQQVALPVSLAATSADVQAVHLTATGPPVDLEPLARQLSDELPDLTVDTVGTTDLAGPAARDRARRDGLVVVAPEVQPRRALADVEQLLAISQWPLLGVVTYPASIWRRRPARHSLRSRYAHARAAVAAMVERRRRAPEHAGMAGSSKLLTQSWLRLRRLARLASGTETEP